MLSTQTIPAISVFIITCNEIDKIEDVINSVAILDEVIVVDSGSTDGTIEKARSLGATVIHQDWLGFAKQKNLALQQCKNQWCFNLDGDEVVPKKVLDEILEHVALNQVDAIRVNFEDIFMGSPMHPKSHKRSIVRVYKKEKVAFPLNKQVHENVKVTGTVHRIKGNIIHYGYQTTEMLMAKQNQYSSLGALEKHQKGQKASVMKLVCVFPIIFFKCLFLRKMCLSGWRGLIHSAIEAQYAFLKEAKLFELNLTNKK